MVEPSLCSAEPVTPLLQRILVGAQSVAKVEVAVAKRLLFDARVHPIPVHTERPEHHLAVVAPQIAVERQEPFGLQFHKHGVYELYNIVATQLGQQSEQLEREHCAAQLARTAHERVVARIVFPEVTVGNHRHLVAQLAQSLGQSGVHVAVFAQQEYLHLSVYLSFFISGNVATSILSPNRLDVMRRNQRYFRV